MTLPAGELRRILTPLERSVLATAVKARSGDPDKLLVYLRGAGVTVPVQRRTTLGSRPLTREDVVELLGSARRALESAARRRAYREAHPELEPPRTLRVMERDPEPVTVSPLPPSGTMPRTLPTTPERSDGMEASNTAPEGAPTPPSGGFVDRINAEAQAEVARVLRDLKKLRFEAHQVEHVLKALKLPVPEELAHFINWYVPGAIQQRAAEKAQAVVAGDPSPPLPEPPAAPEQAQAEETPAPASEAVTKAQTASRGQRAEDALEVLKLNPQGLSSTEVADAIKSRPTSTRDALAKLAEDGLAVTRGSGPRTRWFFVEHASPEDEPLEEPEGKAAGRRPPEHPGIEAVPEHLRHLPAAQKGGPVAQRIAAAEGQMTVLEAVNRSETAVVPEVTKATGLPQARVGDYLRELYEAGLIQRTGRNRRAEGQTRGRAGVEYAGVERAEAAEAPAEEEDSGGLEVAPETLARVRDFVCSAKESFTVEQVVEGAQVDEFLARKALSSLISRQVVKYVGFDDLELYEYNPPRSPGRAAELDAQRPRESVSANGNGSAPVAGTGRGVGASDKDVQLLIRQVKNAGGEVEKTGSDHYRVRNPRNGRAVIIYGTPGAPSRDKNRKRIQAIGLDI